MGCNRSKRSSRTITASDAHQHQLLSETIYRRLFNFKVDVEGERARERERERESKKERRILRIHSGACCFVKGGKEVLYHQIITEVDGGHIFGSMSNFVWHRIDFGR